jgi:hypothetical protein
MRYMNTPDESRFRLEASRAIDATLAASFPASDPPAWNSGFASLIPVETSSPIGRRLPGVGDGPVARGPGVIYVSRPSESEWTLRSAVIGVLFASTIALLAPLAVLLVGLPVALAVRAVLEVVLWFVPSVR